MSRHTLWQKNKRMFLWFIIIILILAVSGSIYQTIAAAQDIGRYVPFVFIGRESIRT